MPIEDCPPRAPLENPPPDPRALANERVGAPMSEAMRKTAMRCERVTMTFPFTRRMGLLIETGSILTGLCEENLINHCGDSHGERGMIRITSLQDALGRDPSRINTSPRGIGGIRPRRGIPARQSPSI